MRCILAGLMLGISTAALLAQSLPFPGPGGVASGSCGGITTVFTAIQDTQNAGNASFSFRNLTAQSPQTGGNQVRVTWSATTSYTLDTSSICISAGSGGCVASPVQLLYGGGASAVVPLSGSLVSDWASITAISTDDFLVTGDVNAGTGTIANKSSGGSSWFKAGATYNVQTPAGLTSSPRFWMVTKVELRTC